MKPTLINILLIFTFIFILRFIVLEFCPFIIVNGYFSIFLCFFVITIIFTNNYLFSTIIGLIIINFRILYRSIKDKKTLNEYNNISNCLIFIFGLLLLAILLVYFKKIDKLYSRYYEYFITILILINLYSLKINENDSVLLCFS
jgi:hypothetical protein